MSAATAKEALGNVLQERRRELTCHGLRWMDQRRLANDPDFPTQTVTRIFKGTTYTLEPGAVRYTFPMGEKYLEENPTGFVLISDLTSFVQVGDVVNLSLQKGIQIIELKEGKKNEENIL